MNVTPLKEEQDEHLLSCVASLTGKTRGSGFFVDSDLLLTCAHVAGVVGDEVTIDVHLRGPCTGKVVAISPEAEEDLALVEVTLPPDGSVQYALPLADINDADDAFAPGYPGFQPAPGAAITSPEYQRVPLHVAVTRPLEGGVARLNIDQGEVNAGLSGSAIISATRLAVVGVVRHQRQGGDGLTHGGATPISIARRIFERLQTLVDNPPASTFKWRQLSGVARLEDENRPVLSVHVTGNPATWGVRNHDDEDEAFTVEVLGEEVGSAVFAWMSGRHPHSTSDVERIGHLLGSALLAGRAGQKVRQQRSLGVPFDLRLTFEGDCELQDAPWELAQIPQTTDVVSTISLASFSRVGIDLDGHGDGARDSSDMLAIVLPLTRGGTFSKRTDGSLDKLTGVRIDEPEEPLTSSVMNMIESDETAYGIVHYAGWVSATEDGAELEIDSDREERVDVDVLAEVCGRRGVRLLVIQHRAEVKPSKTLRPAVRPPLSVFSKLVAHGLDAIVVTQFPVSDRAIAAFNRSFYLDLKEGMRVEDAVQNARRELQKPYQKIEATAFGAFVVFTAPSGGPVLFSPTGIASSGMPLVNTSRGPSWGR